MKLYEQAIKQLEKSKPKPKKIDNTGKRIDIISRLLQARYGFSGHTEEHTIALLAAEYNEPLVTKVIEEMKQRSKQYKAGYHIGLQLAAEKVQKRGVK